MQKTVYIYTVMFISYRTVYSTLVHITKWKSSEVWHRNYLLGIDVKNETLILKFSGKIGRIILAH